MVIKTKQFIDVGDWDGLVEQTYGKPYSFQQQDGCRERGNYSIYISTKEIEDDWPSEIEYQINGDEQGVSFKTWLATEPHEYERIFWERNFYPAEEVLAADLYKKGLLPYTGYIDIEVDW